MPGRPSILGGCGFDVKCLHEERKRACPTLPHCNGYTTMTPAHERIFQRRIDERQRGNAVGFLVSGAAFASSAGPKFAASHAARRATRDWTRRAREALCAARRVPASWHAAFVRAIGWRDGRVQLSRLAIRRAHRAVPRNSVDYRGLEASHRSHLCRELPLPRARRLHLGLRDRAEFTAARTGAYARA